MRCVNFVFARHIEWDAAARRLTVLDPLQWLPVDMEAIHRDGYARVELGCWLLIDACDGPESEEVHFTMTIHQPGRAEGQTKAWQQRWPREMHVLRLVYDLRDTAIATNVLGTVDISLTGNGEPLAKLAVPFLPAATREIEVERLEGADDGS